MPPKDASPGISLQIIGAIILWVALVHTSSGESMAKLPPRRTELILVTRPLVDFSSLAKGTRGPCLWVCDENTETESHNT